MKKKWTALLLAALLMPAAAQAGEQENFNGVVYNHAMLVGAAVTEANGKADGNVHIAPYRAPDVPKPNVPGDWAYTSLFEGYEPGRPGVPATYAGLSGWIAGYGHAVEYMDSVKFADQIEQGKRFRNYYKAQGANSWVTFPWWDIAIGAFRGPAGQSYFVYEGCAKTYEEAKAFCRSHGGHLAVIDSAEEERYIYIAMRDLGYGAAYIGLSRTPSGTWLWADGKPLSYANWKLDAAEGSCAMLTYAAPLYVGADGALSEERVSAFEFLLQSSSAWSRADFDGNIPFICEWE